MRRRNAFFGLAMVATVGTSCAEVVQPDPSHDLGCWVLEQDGPKAWAANILLTDSLVITPSHARPRRAVVPLDFPEKYAGTWRYGETTDDSLYMYTGIDPSLNVRLQRVVSGPMVPDMVIWSGEISWESSATEKPGWKAAARLRRTDCSG
jgi:hypothetical protein